MLPQIHDEDLRGSEVNDILQTSGSGTDLTTRQREQSTLPLEILILPAFSPIRTLDIHNEQRGGLSTAHPYTFRSLLTSRLVHDVECRSE